MLKNIIYLIVVVYLALRAAICIDVDDGASIVDLNDSTPHRLQSSSEGDVMIGNGLYGSETRTPETTRNFGITLVSNGGDQRGQLESPLSISVTLLPLPPPVRY